MAMAMSIGSIIRFVFGRNLMSAATVIASSTSAAALIIHGAAGWQLSGSRQKNLCRSDVPDWYLTKDGDRSCLALYRRHYSCRNKSASQFVGPGEHIVLRTDAGNAVFVWRNYIDDTIPAQEGIECSLFRNESPRQSSELIRQADQIADHCWPHQRHYTKVGAKDIRSVNPGFCFIAAGWRRCGYTQNGLLILEKMP